MVLDIQVGRLETLLLQAATSRPQREEEVREVRAELEYRRQPRAVRGRPRVVLATTIPVEAGQVEPQEPTVVLARILTPVMDQAVAAEANQLLLAQRRVLEATMVQEVAGRRVQQIARSPPLALARKD